MTRRVNPLLILPGLTMTLSVASAGEPAPPPSKPETSTVCVQVRIGNATAADFHCLNKALEEMAAKASARRAELGTAFASATSLAPTQVGLFNVTATKERLGASFGHSPFPQRPVLVPVVPLLR